MSAAKNKTRYNASVKDKILQILQNPLLDLKTPIRSDQAADLFLIYLEAWKKWNPKIGLTSENDAAAVIERHFFDSLQYARVLEEQGRALDIGSGAGFPGIPLKIVCPGLNFLLVESQRKRASFLKTVIGQLALDQIAVHHGRVEDLLGEEKGAFDFVLFRAVDSLTNCLRIGSPFLRRHGRLVIKKEPEAQADQALKDFPGLRLDREVPVRSLARVQSKLMVFVQCST